MTFTYHKHNLHNEAGLVDYMDSAVPRKAVKFNYSLTCGFLSVKYMYVHGTEET